MAPILSEEDCRAAAENLHLLLNDTRLSGTDRPEVPEGCYLCHDLAKESYTLWLGQSSRSYGRGTEASVPKKTRQPICAELGPLKHWEVVRSEGASVRAEACDSCRELRQASAHEVLIGQEQGNWLRLAPDAGYLRLRKAAGGGAERAEEFLRPARAFAQIRRLGVRCAGLGRVPIHDMQECSRAAAELGLKATRALDTMKEPTPEGCYYLENSAGGSLWLNTNPENRGRGMQRLAGNASRLPLCGLGQLVVAPKPTPGASPPTPAPTPAPGPVSISLGRVAF